MLCFMFCVFSMIVCIWIVLRFVSWFSDCQDSLWMLPTLPSISIVLLWWGYNSRWIGLCFCISWLCFSKPCLKDLTRSFDYAGSPVPRARDTRFWRDRLAMLSHPYASWTGDSSTCEYLPGEGPLWASVKGPLVRRHVRIPSPLDPFSRMVSRSCVRDAGHCLDTLFATGYGLTTT